MLGDLMAHGEHVGVLVLQQPRRALQRLEAELNAVRIIAAAVVEVRVVVMVVVAGMAAVVDAPGAVLIRGGLAHCGRDPGERCSPGLLLARRGKDVRGRGGLDHAGEPVVCIVVGGSKRRRGCWSRLPL